MTLELVISVSTVTSSGNCQVSGIHGWAQTDQKGFLGSGPLGSIPLSDMPVLLHSHCHQPSPAIANSYLDAYSSLPVGFSGSEPPILPPFHFPSAARMSISGYKLDAGIFLLKTSPGPPFSIRQNPELSSLACRTYMVRTSPSPPLHLLPKSSLLFSCHFAPLFCGHLGSCQPHTNHRTFAPVIPTTGLPFLSSS